MNKCRIELKSRAVTLRRQGMSLPSISKELGIPKSTLSGWLRDVKLTREQKLKLHNNWREGLVKARKGAVHWHNQQKAKRLELAKTKALSTLSRIDLADTAVLELALAILYLAEGSKKNVETALGSSDPLTLRFFLLGLTKVFKYDVNTVHGELYLRADQNPEVLKKYWSKQLDIPIQNFKHISIDKRSLGTPTYDSYKGVCSLRCGNVAFRRQLVYLAEEYFGIIGQKNLCD